MNIKDKLSLENIPEGAMECISESLATFREVGNTVSEFNGYFGLIKVGIDKRRETKCKRFLEGLAARIYSDEGLNAADHQKLEKLLSNDKNNELVIDILEEALNSVSYMSSKILGVIAGGILKDSRDYNYKDWIIVNGLKNMNDWDIENFKRLCLYFNTYPEQEATNSACVYLNLPMKQYENSNGTSIRNIIHDEDFKLFKSSLIKMNNLQILSTGIMLIDDDNVSFVRSSIATELYELINIIDNR